MIQNDWTFTVTLNSENKIYFDRVFQANKQTNKQTKQKTTTKNKQTNKNNKKKNRLGITQQLLH